MIFKRACFSERSENSCFLLLSVSLCRLLSLAPPQRVVPPTVTRTFRLVVERKRQAEAACFPQLKIRIYLLLFSNLSSGELTLINRKLIFTDEVSVMSVFTPEHLQFNHSYRCARCYRRIASAFWIRYSLLCFSSIRYPVLLGEPSWWRKRQKKVPNLPLKATCLNPGRAEMRRSGAVQ